MSTKEALNEAISKLGGLKPFADAIGAPSPGAVKQWRIDGVPAVYCPTIERVSGVRCERLRPSVEWTVLRDTRKEAA